MECVLEVVAALIILTVVVEFDTGREVGWIASQLIGYFLEAFMTTASSYSSVGFMTIPSFKKQWHYLRIVPSELWRLPNFGWKRVVMRRGLSKTAMWGCLANIVAGLPREVVSLLTGSSPLRSPAERSFLELELETPLTGDARHRTSPYVLKALAPTSLIVSQWLVELVLYLNSTSIMEILKSTLYVMKMEPLLWTLCFGCMRYIDWVAKQVSMSCSVTVTWLCTWQLAYGLCSLSCIVVVSLYDICHVWSSFMDLA